MWVSSEASPIIVNESYSQISVHTIVALFKTEGAQIVNSYCDSIL